MHASEVAKMCPSRVPKGDRFQGKSLKRADSGQDSWHPTWHRRDQNDWPTRAVSCRQRELLNSYCQPFIDIKHDQVYVPFSHQPSPMWCNDQTLT